METLYNSTNENSRRNLNDDPQYFGAYLNLARLNIFSINNHLAEEFKQKNRLTDEEHIRNSFICNSNIKNLNYNWLFEKLIRLMPIVKQFDSSRLPEEEQKKGDTEGKNLLLMAETLKEVFKDIQDFRNDYTHYYSVEKGDERKLNVSSATADFLVTSFHRAIEYTKSRFANVFSEDDFKLIQAKQLVLSNNSITVEGLVFLTAMFLDRENAFQFIGKVQGLKGTQFKSFIASREVLMAYCVRLPHDKLISDDPKQALLLDMLNELDRCPKLLYNVLSEDAKKQFRPILTKQSIEQVLENSVSDEERENILDNIDYSEYIEQLTVRVRHSNRFHYFAMRFIDEQNLLPDFFFQIDLGKYKLSEYEKSILGQSIPRSIIENAKAFGRLSKFVSEDDVQKIIDPGNLANGFEQFAPHYNTDINKIGFRFNEDICHIESIDAKAERRISVNLIQPQPMGFLSLHELSKIILLEYLQPGESIKLIRQFYKTANTQLFNIDFIELVKTKLPTNWGDLEKQCDTKNNKAYRNSKASLYELQKRKEELDKVLQFHGLNWTQIPERILNYWLNIQDVSYSKSISERILLMKRDGLKRLKQLKNHSNRPDVRIPKVGEMATFIARDIVDMIIDEEKKKKITSIYYDKLQECLAFYADKEKKQQLIGLVRELQLNLQGGHPFLKNLRLESIRKTSEFYELYLTEKFSKLVHKGLNQKGKPQSRDESWIIRTFEKKEWSDKAKKNLTVYKFPDNMKELPFSMQQWINKEQYDLRGWLRNINEGRNRNDQKRPIDLPTNLFNNKLCELLTQELRLAGKAIPNTTKYYELLRVWWLNRDDSVQGFYKGSRSYIIKDELVSFIPDSQPNFKKYYQEPLNKAFIRLSQKRQMDREKDKKLPVLDKTDIEKTFKKTLFDTEKNIRLLAEDDRILLLMAEKLSPGDGSGHLKLNNIKKELNKEQIKERAFQFRPNYDDAGNMPEKGVLLPEIQLIVEAKIRLKNIKDLNRFAYDRRLPELIAYLPNGKIGVNELRYELTDYNKARQEVFDEVFRLEKTIIQKDADGLLALCVNERGIPLRGNIAHKYFLQWLINHGYISEQERKYLNMIRNSFSHNQFPHKLIVSYSQNQINQKGIASIISSAFKEKTESIIYKID